jgi:Gly-Xaa carboxypeptidase
MISIWALASCVVFFATTFFFHAPRLGSFNVDYCPVGGTIRPSDFIRDNSSVEFIIHDRNYRDDSVAKLAGAIQHQTVSYDGLNIDTINGTQFEEFHRYLAKEFPLTHNQLTLEKINKYGLVYTWNGSNSTLKPIVFTAHQDTVPVDEGTRSQWLHDPFSGYFDGENIWGRGSSDCKTMIIGYLQAIEKLLEEGFVPRRTVIFAYGFDEEIGGLMGATTISNHLFNRYGKNGIYSLLDEGGTAMAIVGGTVVAQPAVGEKGVLGIRISLTTPGGHSSVPPEHTNIGLVSKLVSVIEDSPFPQIMETTNPIFNYLQCLSQHTDEFEPEFKRDVLRSAWDIFAKERVLKFLDSVRDLRFLVRTTQAVDIIHGGVKSNALPEFTTVDINHRISVESSVNVTLEKIVDNVKAIAKEHSLGVYLEEKELLPKTANGSFNITIQAKLEPARVSPLDAEQWDLLRGSVKHIIEDYIYPDISRPAVVAGSLNTGNTDTSHYWDLTEHIYRYRLSAMHGITEGHTHSVNEHTTINNHLYLVAFSYEYIKSVSEFSHN